MPRAIVLNEDDQDGDFNPTGDSTTKMKGKSKAKENAAKLMKSKGKSKGSAAVGISPKAQVEVGKEQRESQGMAKNEGKQKDATAVDKEVFKSCEFIEDEIQLVGSAAVADDDIPPPASMGSEARSDVAAALTRPTGAGGLATSSSFAAPSKGSNAPLLPTPTHKQ